mmetsp:Transcript_26699/g.61447  ORF Transcript_26699/g.61447 Transcript_26699/m.61447 type:complete len:897 (+) Transcript_26699:53-2743(+)
MAPKEAAKSPGLVKKEDDTKKRKAEEATTAEPKAKEAKKEDEFQEEKDATKETRSTIKDPIAFLPSHTTLNVVPTTGGRILMSLTDGGMQYLLAGARANVGMKKDRYMFEVKVVEALVPQDNTGPQARARLPVPRQLVRLGVSTSDSSLLLDDEDSVYFDSEGFFVSGSEKKSVTERKLTKDQVVAVVVNLDPKGQHPNTISLFREGKRVSSPMPLPEKLKGKMLYPHIVYRNVTLQTHFGPTPLKALPFKCKCFGSAASADVNVIKETPLDKAQSFQVCFPVAFPDEGTFDWVDTFLQEHQEFVELSDRKIIEWAEKSGLQKPKAVNQLKHSNDKPDFNFGVPTMDDLSVRKILRTIAPAIPRHYLVMEVKGNLTAADRKEMLKRFSAPCYKKVAKVVMGEPNEEFKAKAMELLLAEKKVKAEADWKAQKAEKERQKQVKQKQKELEEMRKKAEEARKKAIDDAKKKKAELEAKQKAEADAKKAEEAKKKAEEAGEDAEMPEAEVKDEEMEAKEEVKDEEEDDKKDDVAMETKEEETKEEEEEEMDESPPEVVLTEEEQKTWFRPKPVTDLTTAVLSQAFGTFTLPEEGEGFDAIDYEWDDATKSQDYLRNWVLERKRTSRIEDLVPSDWFKERLGSWHKSFEEWNAKQKAHKEGKTKPAEKKEPTGDEEEEKADVKVDNIFNVEDVCDIGNGEPLFANFNFEDWALLQLRFELYLLAMAFKHDVDDADRPGVPEQHLQFYYSKYFLKQFMPKNYGMTTCQEVVELIKDTVLIDAETKVLQTNDLQEDVEVSLFVKVTEENRRERQRRIDAGDETAKLKLTPLAMQKTSQAALAKAGVAGPAKTGMWQQAKFGTPAGATAPFRPPAAASAGWARPPQQAFAPKAAWGAPPSWRGP